MESAKLTQLQEQKRKVIIMKLRKQAMAGTMKSSDLMVVVQPSDELSITIQSPVIKQFGNLVLNTCYS